MDVFHSPESDSSLCPLVCIQGEKWNAKIQLGKKVKTEE
jgi:hypothetical protein